LTPVPLAKEFVKNMLNVSAGDDAVRTDV
jgi:hypothetical protein